MSDEVKIPLPRSLQEIVGALLFASEDPLTAGELRDAVRAVEPEEGENAEVMEVYKTCTGREIDQALKGLGKALEVAGCGFQLVTTGGTYRLQSVPSCGRYVRAMLKMDRPSRLGRASLETLAIIAYRQPITKSEIEEIRGVDVSANVKTLMDMQIIRLVGKSELPGHPFLYGTTPFFLEHFGLSTLQQLNDLDPTLQRSNPRVKAAAYRRPEKPAAKTELEQAAEEAKAEEAKKATEQAETSGAAPSEGSVGEVETAGAVAEPTQTVLFEADGEDEAATADEDESPSADGDENPSAAGDDDLLTGDDDEDLLADDDDEDLLADDDGDGDDEEEEDEEEGEGKEEDDA